MAPGVDTAELGSDAVAEPLRVVQVGAGAMGRTWLRTLGANPDTTVVGLVDLDPERAGVSARDAGLDGVVVGESLAAVLAEVGADAVVNVTIPEAHHEVNLAAFAAGVDVLCEKPAAPTVATALRSAAAAATSGRLLMVSQSRRYYPEFAALQAAARELGSLAAVSVEFFKAPHFGGFREQMDHVLLVDMAIHAFDAARHLIGAEPVAVHCEEWNPAHSWFAHGASAAAVFEFAGGVRFVWQGSWCADGAETSWNGSWRVNGAAGTLLWDGTAEPVLHPVGGEARRASGHAIPYPGRETAGALQEFVASRRSGLRPAGHIEENLGSLLMVEAAVRSAESGSRVALDEVFAEARRQALRDEEDPVLVGWLREARRP